MLTRIESRYGYDDTTGELIVAPKGWRILIEGQHIPQVHREFHIDVYRERKGQWAQPRRCHSTMTPFEAQLWGSVRAFAVLEYEEWRVSGPYKDGSASVYGPVMGTIVSDLTPEQAKTIADAHNGDRFLKKNRA